MSMEEFHQIFFEEADELIEAMEAELLEMVFDPDNTDRINNVFRAAHSIKGGAATFGFAEITDTTHVMETLMNSVRDGEIKVSRDLIDLLLRTVDCVKDMLGAAKNGEPADAERAAEAKTALEGYLNGEPQAPAGDEAAAGAPETPGDEDEHGAVASVSMRHYVIEFKPSHELFRTGNDPLHIFRALRELGDLTVEVHDDTVPDLTGYKVDKLYLAWTLRLDTQVDPEVVLEAFDWVEDISEIDLQEVSAPQAAAAEHDSAQPDTHAGEVSQDEACADTQASPAGPETAAGRMRRAAASRPRAPSARAAAAKPRPSVSASTRSIP